MSRSENIDVKIADRFKPLTTIRREAHHHTHLPRKYAEVNAALARVEARKSLTGSVKA